MRARLESFAVSKLDLFFHDVPLGYGTGFLYRFGETLGLVSNWHVFSGSNPLTRKRVDTRGYYPNRVEFHINLFNREEGTVVVRGEDLPLVADGQSLWWQHEDYGGAGSERRIVDIGVLPLNSLLPDFAGIQESIISLPAQVLVALAKDGRGLYAEEGYARVAAEVFILGYPQGLTKQGVLPVWKRGSIASEPLFNALDNDPVILVDAVTRGGMSGAPTLYFGDEITNDRGVVHATYTGHEKRSDQPWLIGVYSGREGVTPDEVALALGRVWRKPLLDEIFAHPILGQIPPP
jgi:hypothetical protein